MKIVIVTTANEKMKETGFGKMESCRDVLRSLKKRSEDVSISLCETQDDLRKVLDQNPDIVILAVKYVQLGDDKKIWLSKYFEDAGINFTGSKRAVLEYDSNKIKAKELLLSKGVQTADFFKVTPDNYQDEAGITLPYPIFLKPLDAANGNGVDDESLVYDFEGYKKKAKTLFDKYGKIAIAEKFLSGREFTVAVVEDENNELIIAPIEIIPPENKNKIRILGEKVKNENTEELKKVVDESVNNKLKEIAAECFRVLGVRDFGRIDIKMDENGVCNYIEANLVPGMTQGSSYFPMALEVAVGLNYDEVTSLILDNAIRRASETK